MEAWKHVDCDILSSIETAEKLINEDDDSGVGRAYECTFCKRGFTNAQALGGHMNIHRKDKAKVKKRNGEAEPSNQSNYIEPVQKFLNPRCFSHVSSGDQGHQVSYQVYFPSSNPSSCTSLTQNYQKNIPVWRPQDQQFIDYMKVNYLSMRIGLMPPLVDEEEGYRHRFFQESEVDLELRLGHDP